MPVFVAFAAFMLLLFGPRIGLSIGSWVITQGPFAQKRKTPGQKSGVRTAMLEMVLDHDSGRMEGKCLKGRFEGRVLSSLSCNERSEERRVGKECRSRWSAYHSEKKRRGRMCSCSPIQLTAGL